MGHYSGLLIIAVPLVLLLMLNSRTRRQQREVAGVQASLQPGQEVMVGAGMYARVVSVDGDDVVLETAPGVQSRWVRRAVVRVLSPRESAPEAAGGAPGTTSARPDDAWSGHEEEDRPAGT